MDEKIERILELFNPWWVLEEPLVPIPPYHRHPFARLKGWMEGNRKPHGILLEGPRQVGKSTILKQLIRHLGKPKAVLYVSFDHPQLSDVPLGDWLNPWLENRKAHPVKYIFFDEITYLKKWDHWLKHFLDTRNDIRVIATSSYASLLRDKSRETGPGRWDEIWLPPFTFGEILDWQRQDLSADKEMGPWVFIPPPKRDSSQSDRLWNVLREYLERGGFPAVWVESNLEKAYERLKRDGIDRAIFKDLSILYEIRNPQILERLFYRVALDTGRIVSVERLARELPASQPTVEKNLGLLQESGLLLSLKLYPGTSRRGIGGQPKVVLSDPALLMAAFSTMNTLKMTPEIEGFLLETIVANHLSSLTKIQRGHLSYWRKGEIDVDFVVEVDPETVPIQVTRATKIDQSDLVALEHFLNVHKKRSSTGLLLYNGPERDLPVSKDGPIIACRNLAFYLQHLSQGMER